MTIQFTEAEKNVIYNEMRDKTVEWFRFLLISYDDGIEIGTHDFDAKGYITNALPTIDERFVRCYDENPMSVIVTGDDQIIVQNQSELVVSFPSASGTKGAVISKYAIEFNNITTERTQSGEYPLGQVATSGNLPLKITVTDSRGNKITVEKQIEVVEYKEPVILPTIRRKNNYEDETHIKIGASYSSVKGLNTIEASYQYAKVGESYGDAIPIPLNAEYVISCEKQSAYNFLITATDKFNTVTKEFVLTKGEFPLFIDIVKNAVGINAFPKDKEALRVGNGIAMFEDGIVLQSSTEGSAKRFLLTVDDSGQLTVQQYTS